MAEAVQAAMRAHKPLVCLVGDGWPTQLASKPTVAQILAAEAVLLELAVDSLEYKQLASLVPLIAPSLLVLATGSIALQLTEAVSENEFVSKWREKFPAPERSSSIQAPGPLPQSGTEPGPLPQPGPQSGPQPALVSAAQAAPQAAQAVPAPVPAPAAPTQTRRVHTPSILAATRAAPKASTKAVEQERERIRMLVEQDKRNREANQAARSPHTTQTNPTRRGSGTAARNAALAIRNFDGTVLKHQFTAVENLADVRIWLAANVPGPYQFAQAYPPRTFSASQESQTLAELGLTPSAALVLKPTEHQALGWGQWLRSWW